MKKKIENNFYIIEVFAISTLLSIIITFLYKKGIISSGMECIPHILTVSSIVLGVVTLVLTINDLYSRWEDI